MKSKSSVRSLMRLIVMGGAILMPAVASAHVRVSPSSVGIAKNQLFTLSVPTEKEVPTTSVRLVIPSGLSYVTPSVKPGWQIETTKSGDNVTEITWTKGTVPAGQRDDFTFSAVAPEAPTELKWKAYQTYADSSVVSWDQATEGDDSDSDKGPYSVTNVVDDLATDKTSSTDTGLIGAYIVGGLGLLLGLGGLVRRRR